MVYRELWTPIETLKVEGKRYPLERGRLFKVKGERGVFRVMNMFAHKDDPNRIEIHAWWRDKETFTGGKAMWRYVTPNDVKRILGKLEKV